jgi:TIR domain
MAESATPPPGRIFISYRREETAYPAGWLYDRLIDRYGGQVFKDVDSIELGDDFVEVITRAVGSCDVLLALVGEEWLTITDEDGRRRLDDPDDFVRVEIEAALTRNVRVIPILVGGARMPRSNELPPSLARLVRRQALELSPARFEYDTSRLLTVLDRTLAEVRAAQEDAAAVSAPAAETPDPRTTELGTAFDRRKQAEPGPPISIAPAVAAMPGSPSPSDLGKPPDKQRRRLSTRARILAGVGAFAAVISLLIVIVVVNSDTTPPQTVGPSPGAEPGSDAAISLASFENSTEGWLPEEGQEDNGSVSQASDFHTEGSFGLRIDSNGLPERGFYGKNFDPAVDMSGKSAVSVDIMTLETRTQTAIAVQVGDAWLWCQSPNPWGVAEAGTELLTVTLDLDLDTMDCPEGQPSPSDLTKLRAVWVWFEGKGTFWLDHVRVE